MTATPTSKEQVALLEQRGWTRVDRFRNEWVHENEDAVYSLTAACRRELRATANTEKKAPKRRFRRRVHTTKS